MRACFFCAKEIPIERRHSVFCSLRCELTYQELERRAPPLESEPRETTGEGRPRETWPGTGDSGSASDEKF